VKLSRRTKVAAAVAGAASFALLAAGCSSSGGDAGTSSNPITLTVTTFGTMGFDKLYSQYEKEHPGIKIKATNIDTGGNALTDWKTKQASGGLLACFIPRSSTFSLRLRVDLRQKPARPNWRWK